MEAYSDPGVSLGMASVEGNGLAFERVNHSPVIIHSGYIPSYMFI